MVKLVLIVIGVAAVLLQLGHCANTRGPADAEAHIEPGAVIAMAPEQYPQMLERLGPTAFARANSLMHPAALYAAKLGSCSMVESVGVSDQSTVGDIQYFVDCKDGDRVRVSEAELR